MSLYKGDWKRKKGIRIVEREPQDFQPVTHVLALANWIVQFKDGYRSSLPTKEVISMLTLEATDQPDEKQLQYLGKCQIIFDVKVRWKSSIHRNDHKTDHALLDCKL